MFVNFMGKNFNRNADIFRVFQIKKPRKMRDLFYCSPFFFFFFPDSPSSSFFFFSLSPASST